MKNLIIFSLLFSIILLHHCSFDRKTGIWKEHNKKIIQEVKNKKKIEKIFKEKINFEKEIDSTELITISKKKNNTNWLEDNLKEDNNVSHLNYFL